LASLLWEECSTAQSKRYLRQALWQLQTVCEEHLGRANGRLLLVGQERIQLNPEIELWADVTVFNQAFSRLQAAQGLDESAARVLDEAVRLYKEDLLVGEYQDWLLYERERLQNMYLSMLDKLAEYCEANQDYAASIDYSVRILQYDPARERTHQQIMRMYYLSGDRTAALRQYDRCVEALKKELDVEPSKRTLALREQIRADLLNSYPSANSHPAEAFATSLPDLLAHLKQLQSRLADLQGELQQDIRIVEHLTSRNR